MSLCRCVAALVGTCVSGCCLRGRVLQRAHARAQGGAAQPATCASPLPPPPPSLPPHTPHQHAARVSQMTIEFFESETEVEVFLKGIKPLINFTFWLAGVSVLSFFAGLCLIGRVGPTTPGTATHHHLPSSPPAANHVAASSCALPRRSHPAPLPPPHMPTVSWFVPSRFAGCLLMPGR
jgi:hypothetical protein